MTELTVNAVVQNGLRILLSFTKRTRLPHLTPPFAIKKYVCRLYVPVDGIFTVQECHASANICDESPGLHFG